MKLETWHVLLIVSAASVAGFAYGRYHLRQVAASASTPNTTGG